jgi:hypothetical protein
MQRPARLALACLLLGAPARADVTEQDAPEIAVDAYVYAYPLVLMEISRRVMTNVEAAEGLNAPMNQFAHASAFPDASFTAVVRPNVDTLYSTVWFDVSKEPLVIDVPDSGGRYFLLPMLDAWTDVFASPGTRTTGNGAQTHVIVGPTWRGVLPKGVAELRSPTSVGWLIGRTQTNGTDDYEAVHAFQSGLKATPLSRWGKPYTPPKGTLDPAVEARAPVEQVHDLSAAAFFALFADASRGNPPHANDYPILQRMQRIGLEPGKPFDLAKSPAALRSAVERGVPAAQQKIVAATRRLGTTVNGWQMTGSPIGTYGTDYLRRAAIAYGGLGANVLEDAVYPSAHGDADGKPFDNALPYTMHFTKEQIPPVRAFWSLTVYNDKQLLAENPIGRHALGDRDRLRFNTDGSLDVYIQRASPGPERESNWLPAPAEGPFTMNLRLYWPKPEALDGTWTPPPVQRVR